jgi:MoaA/NifB/PqqE/SkfB family radical SAM enzyme
MKFQNLVSQRLKKIISPSGTIYRHLRLINQYIASFKRLKKQNQLIFGTHITDHCNLNCACCNQFSPLLDDGFCSVEAFNKDCLRLFELAGGRIAKIIFSGGEPLLHPKITDFFDIARGCFNQYANIGGGGGFRS